MIDIQPDHPPYYVAVAADQVGFRMPADRPWRPVPPEADEYRCCGLGTRLRLYEFDHDGQCSSYALAQCPHCQSIGFRSGAARGRPRD